MDVKLKRNPETGQMIYEDSTTALGYITAVVQRLAVIGAVLGIEADYATLYAQLLAVKDSLGGLGFEDVKRLVDKAWEPIEGQMQEAGVTHEDVVTALGRHVGELATLGKTLAIVLAERALA